MVELYTKQGEIHVNEMEDGQLGVITDWVGSGNVIGMIVQRYGDHLVTIGAPRGDGWAAFFAAYADGHCRVRVLRSGEMLRVK